jgi:uncharacterized protein YwgA
MERISYSSRCALLVDLVKRLRQKGSWCGETHLQKALYILQDLTKSNFGYKFVLYKHGPYSFDLNAELAAMREAGILEFQFPRGGYGPSIAATTFGERVFEINRENIEEFESVEQFLANWFAASDVRHLEKVATAYYVTKKNPRDPALVRAKKLSTLKPHVDINAAEEAVRIVDEKRQEAKRQLGIAA